MAWSVVFILTFTYWVGTCREHRCRWNLRVLEKLALFGDSTTSLILSSTSRTVCPNAILRGSSVLETLVALVEEDPSVKTIGLEESWDPPSCDALWGEVSRVGVCQRSPCTHIALWSSGLVSGTTEVAFPSPARSDQATASPGTSAPERCGLELVFFWRAGDRTWIQVLAVLWYCPYPSTQVSASISLFLPQLPPSQEPCPKSQLARHGPDSLLRPFQDPVLIFPLLLLWTDYLNYTTVSQDGRLGPLEADPEKFMWKWFVMKCFQKNSAGEWVSGTSEGRSQATCYLKQSLTQGNLGLIL